jgi:hypothetical protein
MIYQENAPDNQARPARRATLDRPDREARLPMAPSTESPCPTTEEVDRAKPEAVEPLPLFLICAFRVGDVLAELGSQPFRLMSPAGQAKFPADNER